jgi:hypothetical protein
MKISPRGFARAAIALALAAVPFVPVTAAAGPGKPDDRTASPGKQAPASTSPPTVSGAAVAGGSLTADPGTWSGSGVKLTIEWQRCDAFGNGCAAVDGATSAQLALGTSEVGLRFRVLVTATNKYGTASALSNLSDMVAAPPVSAPATSVSPSSTTQPVASGVTKQGHLLAADPGSWSGTQPLSYGYQWHRCGSSGEVCSAVAGATGESYTLGTGDVGSKMRVAVTATNSAGSASATSPATEVVASSSSSAGLLTWAPPTLSNPLAVQVRDTGQICPENTARWQNPNQPWICFLDPNRDYILTLGNRRDPGGLTINGGRNVVIVGGQITVPVRTCCDRSDEWKSRGLTLDGQTGVAHVEGVSILNASDAISIKAPLAIVQLQNIRVANLHVYRDDVTLAHPDIIQTFDGPREVRVDRLSADSDWTGLSWFKCCTSTQVFPGRVILKNVNLSGNLQPSTVMKWTDGATRDKPNFGLFTYMNATASVHSCTNCWVSTGWYSQTYRRKLHESTAFVAADGSQAQSPPFRVTGHDGQVVTTLVNNDVGRRQGDYIEWPSIANLAGVRWSWGVPPAGDFVPSGVAGPSYASPGYGG